MISGKTVSGGKVTLKLPFVGMLCSDLIEN
jgi:hypothetical protein